MNEPKVSIVLPVYNGGELLKKTLEIVLASTLRDIEIICVDDSSTDNSLEILNNFQAVDPRVRVINREGKGGTAVKGYKYGLDYAQGEFCLFMSQDDFFDTDALEKMYNRAKETNADAVVPNMVWYFEGNEDNKKILPPGNDYELCLSGQEAFRYVMGWEIHGFYLRKTSLVKKYSFDDTFLTGCEYASREHMYYSNKVVFADTNFYYRQDNDNAITKKFKPITIDDVIVYIKLLEFIKSKKYEKEFLNKWIDYTFGLIKYYQKLTAENYSSLSKENRRLCLKKLHQSAWLFIKFLVGNGNLFLIFKTLYRVYVKWLYLKKK